MNFRKSKKPAPVSNGLNKLKNFVLLIVASSLFLLAIALCASDNTFKPTTDAELSSTSVEIVRNDKRSGGTGVILESSTAESKVLTNGHVCKVITKGGLVITENGREHAVTSYKMSKEHDLCLITVSSDLGISTALAHKAPSLYSAAAISGHPTLLPNIITRGHFSHHVMAEVMTGFRQCTAEDLNGPNAILCALAGGIPLIQRYEAQVVSATIMPGSSGSAIFNDKGEISGLVFAGSGTIGYAMAVPYESVAHFLLLEQQLLDKQFPDNSTGALEELQSSRLRAACSKRVLPENEDLAEACRALETDMLWIR